MNDSGSLDLRERASLARDHTARAVDLLLADSSRTAERQLDKSPEEAFALPTFGTEPLDDISDSAWDDALLDVLEEDTLELVNLA